METILDALTVGGNTVAGGITADCMTVIMAVLGIYILLLGFDLLSDALDRGAERRGNYDNSHDGEESWSEYKKRGKDK